MSDTGEFKALDSKVEKLSVILEKYLDSQEVSFVIQGETLYNHEVSAHFGCLSLFLLKAKDVYEKTFNGAFIFLVYNSAREPRILYSWMFLNYMC